MGGRRTVSKSSEGFSLIEVLVVVVVLAVLAGIAMFRMHATTDRALRATLESDLRNLVTAQEAFYDENQTYASTVEALADMFRLSENVSVGIDSASNTGWGAIATHPSASVVCRIAASSSGIKNPECEPAP